MNRAIGAALTSLLVVGAVRAQPADPVRFSTTIAGERSVIEVRDLPRADAEQAIREAFEAMAEASASLDLSDPESDLSQLNRAAGTGPRLVDQDLHTVLQKTLGFCIWSQKAQGPLGGRLYGLWESAHAPPSNEMLRTPVQAASCENLVLRPETLQASLASGASLDLRHFRAGHAVDRATDSLQQAGAANLWIEHAGVVRALGPGADGMGWSYTPPVFAGMSEGLEAVRLNDQALAVASAHRRRFRFGELDYPPFLDQRTGQPASGVVAVLVATRLALDAQALATTMMVTGNREGQLRLANVVPTPSALWLLGDGSGEPLLATYKWSVLTTR
jgi:thiamine biosynthesis lipoprotein